MRANCEAVAVAEGEREADAVTDEAAETEAEALAPKDTLGEALGEGVGNCSQERSSTWPLAPAVLEPLIVGLRHKGFCFATLREHPQYAAHVRQTADGRSSTALARASGVP
jgi:hypothetical protein